ncbi:VOC family protein [Intestinirhabdus alba]|uniref:Glyoxalase n=1 Tax=Intestinirhabdus alba TaxID=2899544 RepID=A0A6L6IHY9_9ENTR|nr:VOC family protein [Intestinirhabdus alba]MTH45497.1 glyoxalase [Intestinirhabdus alba]
MPPDIPAIDILFIAGFGPITRDTAASAAFYQKLLGLPLSAMPGNEEYLTADGEGLPGAKHFSLWPLAQAAESCFNTPRWPEHIPLPQAWIEFEVRDLGAATDALVKQGYRLLIANRTEPWGQAVTRLLSPEGLLTGLTITPWMRRDVE